MTELKRRDFLRLGLAAIAAPAVIRCYQTLMPIKAFASEAVISDQDIYSYMLNSLTPTWEGEIVTNVRALNSFADNLIRVRISELEIDQVFEKVSVSGDFASGICKIGIRALQPTNSIWYLGAGLIST